MKHLLNETLPRRLINVSSLILLPMNASRLCRWLSRSPSELWIMRTKMHEDIDLTYEHDVASIGSTISVVEHILTSLQ